ncbi:LysR family transcriptional regulator [Verminephrobacter aporrectodeae subsp. tuberculatae]|nr:LysR family transcriptional regulator [Verminephrobacter aporrectodeae subsp. tuberculatae]MCW5288498.1 LysR family transcriptional regulator [Verminephrobacter aporrectodeae subsp. tuberculatae]MCW8197436.1 LysR family transcriptional regulator [Verminephrobacter aporrectodeae subsp. tuberculatae]
MGRAVTGKCPTIWPIFKLQKVHMADLFASLDLNLLRVFQILYQTKSTTKTAEILDISQPVVSRSLKKLRVSFNDRLFEWRNNTMLPTAVAHALFSDVDSSLAHARKALERMHAFDSSSSTATFTLGLTDYAIHAIFPPLFAHIHQKAANVSVIFRPVGFEEAFRAIESGEVEFAITSGLIEHSEVVSDFLFFETYVVIGDPEIIRHPRGTMPIDIYIKHPHALCSFSGMARGWVDDMLVRQNRVRQVRAVFNAFSPMIANLPGTGLLATVPRRFIQYADSHFGLTHWDLPFESVQHAFHLAAHKRRRLTPAQRWFKETLLGSLLDPQADGE